jgi:hypothetical protein
MEYAILVIVVLAVGIYFLNGKEDAVVKPTTPVSKPVVPSVAELKKLTKQQLFDLAEKKSIKVKKSGTKAEVIKQISSVK